MLTLTSEAAPAINALVADQPGAGLRISSESVDGDRITLGLTVTSTPGQGSTFTIHLPLHIPDEQSTGEVAEKAAHDRT